MFGLRRFAIERPVIFWSFVLGSIGKQGLWIGLLHTYTHTHLMDVYNFYDERYYLRQLHDTFIYNLEWNDRPHESLQRKRLTHPTSVCVCVLVTMKGPVMVFTVPKVRREYFGFKGVEALPITYPLPNRARNSPSGYEDA
ncbi:hypothetical protein [Absidia glauca]|uniref:Uncharacterized protein n=1 Tax=Absidia glauca TaxID=4829 RepID=A0A163J8Y8_ABSGL|nr:hypothetical protein [Absidia glauca]